VASVGDIISVTWQQRINNRCFSNRRYFKILDVGGAPNGHQAVLDEMVEQFWSRCRPLMSHFWLLSTANLVNLSELHDRRADGRYDLPGPDILPPPFAYSQPGDPRSALRFSIWGRDDADSDVVTNGLYLSGINQWLAVNQHWNDLAETQLLEDFLKFDNSPSFSPWTLRPQCITGDTKHLREATFVDVRDAQCNPNVRILRKRRLRPPTNPTTFIYP